MKSIPGSITVIIAVLAVNLWATFGLGLDYGQTSTLCVMLTAWTGVNLIFRISMPFTPIRVALLFVVVIGCVLGAVLFPGLFSISPFTPDMWMVAGVVGVGEVAVFHTLYTLFDRWHSRRQARLV